MAKQNRNGCISYGDVHPSQYAGKIIHKNRDSLSNSERESFNSAADHQLVCMN